MSKYGTYSSDDDDIYEYGESRVGQYDENNGNLSTGRGFAILLLLR